MFHACVATVTKGFGLICSAALKTKPKNLSASEVWVQNLKEDSPSQRWAQPPACWWAAATFWGNGQESEGERDGDTEWGKGRNKGDELSNNVLFTPDRRLAQNSKWAARFCCQVSISCKIQSTDLLPSTLRPAVRLWYKTTGIFLTSSQETERHSESKRFLARFSHLKRF